jgi:hypothetical protein
MRLNPLLRAPLALAYEVGAIDVEAPRIPLRRVDPRNGSG